jgi:hypothetical protein
VDSTTFKLAPLLGLRSTRLYFLGTCWPGYRWRIEFPVPLLTLSQLESYLVLCISARIFIIPKLQNIHWIEFISELLSICVDHLPNCYVRPSFNGYRYFLNPSCSFREHLSRALPTEMIFYLLRSIRSERLIRAYSAELMVDMLEVIIKWLQVSVSEWNRQFPQAKNQICV